MITKKIELWAHSEIDALVLGGAVHEVFGDVASAGRPQAVVWRNTGDEQEDTRVDHRQVDAAHYMVDMAPLRYVRTFEVAVADAAALRKKLQEVVDLLPANNAGSFVWGNSISMGREKLSVIEGNGEEATQYYYRPMASAG